MVDPEKIPEIDQRLPTRTEAFLFYAKTSAFRAKHRLTVPSSTRFEKSALADSELVAESRSNLRSSVSAAEIGLQSGKIQNLRIAAALLDKIVVPSGEIFSFWAHIPRPTRRHGFVEGRELREGCIVPSIGGGLCQLSNALYDCSLKAGLEIVEQHGHSRKIPGSLAEKGRDATIFWNYVDLKFRAVHNWQLRAFLTKDELVVQIFAAEIPSAEGDFSEKTPNSSESVESCETCGMTTCFRHPEKLAPAPREFSVWAVDEFSPEFGDYLAENRADGDWLLTPLTSKRKFGATRYPWPTDGFSKILDFPMFTIHRSFVSRRLANQGAERQTANLKFNQALAEKMIRQIPHQANRIVVSLEMLPWFWKNGALGGRHFDVLMTRWPLAGLQEKLNTAAARWPESATLADFRIDDEWCELEQEALAAADSWISPHPEIAKLAPPGKSRLLPWKTPPAGKIQAKGKNIVFPATTVGRNGIYELREVVQRLKIPLKIVGPNVESPDFWNGCDVSKLEPESWLLEAGVLVLPTWISHRPTRLLQAIAAGIPVITTAETGLAELPGVTIVERGDSDSLAEALQKFGKLRSCVETGQL